jgi:transposase
MVAVPTLEEEDAKRPNREHEKLVGERTRVINRMKACLVRLGVSGFKPHRLDAPDKLAALRTGVPLPPATLAEPHRDMARLAFIKAQIKEIETERLARLHAAAKQTPHQGPHAMILLIARVLGVGIETADMLVNEILARKLRDRRAVARCAGLRA